MPRNITYPMLYYASGDDRRTLGFETLVSGQAGVTVNSSIIGVNTPLFVSRQTLSGDPAQTGFLAAHYFTVGTSFNIDSTHLNDTSTVNWLMLYDTSHSMPGLNVGLPWARYPTLPVTWGKATLVNGIVNVGCFYYSGNLADVYFSFDTASPTAEFLTIGTHAPGVFQIVSSNNLDNSVVNWFCTRRTDSGLNFNARAGGLTMLDSAGATATYGTATLVGGQVTVNTTSVAANDNIMVSYDDIADPNAPRLFLDAPSASIVPGVSFLIRSQYPADVSAVNWWILKSSDNP